MGVKAVVGDFRTLDGRFEVDGAVVVCKPKRLGAYHVTLERDGKDVGDVFQRGSDSPTEFLQRATKDLLSR